MEIMHKNNMIYIGKQIRLYLKKQGQLQPCLHLLL